MLSVVTVINGIGGLFISELSNEHHICVKIKVGENDV